MKCRTPCIFGRLYSETNLFTTDYFGSHSNFKPKQVYTVSLTITATELQAIKDKNLTQR